MKIRSSFRDYYDNILAYGQDSDVVYLRYPREEKLINKYLYRYSGFNCKNLSINPYVIGFCDKIYHFLEINLINYDPGSKESRNKRRFCYSVEDVDGFVKANFSERDFELYSRSELTKSWSIHENRNSFEHFFKTMNKEEHIKKYRKYFADHPIFIILPLDSYYSKEGSTIIYNPCLKDYEFYKFYDSNTVFQELSMWLGNNERNSYYE